MYRGLGGAHPFNAHVPASLVHRQRIHNVFITSPGMRKEKKKKEARSYVYTLHQFHVFLPHTRTFIYVCI